MAWTDQCKIAFKTNADALLWKKKGRRGITKILRELSSDSGIPFKTLERWYYQLEKEKTLIFEGNDETIEINVENEQSPGGLGGESEDLPLCDWCEKNKVFVDPSMKKPYSRNSKYYGLCKTCREKQLRISQIDKDATEEGGFLTICPSCNHRYHINKGRLK